MTDKKQAPVSPLKKRAGRPTCTYRGVRYEPGANWIAEIREPNRGARLFLGTFNTSIEAAAAYDTAARNLYGPNAELNLPGL